MIFGFFGCNKHFNYVYLLFCLVVMVFSEDSGFRKTIAEKELLRSIQALEESISKETNPVDKELLINQLKELKANLARISGVSYADLLIENQRLRNELSKLKKELEFVSPKNVEGKGAESVENIFLREKLYKLLLNKYSDLINEKEQKTVGEIKAMVSKDDLTIVSLAQELGGPNYDPKKDYEVAAEKAFNYVRDNILFVEADLNISFWLSPNEIVSEKIGDSEDQAVFLCSLLYALGDEKAECVIAEMSNSKTHAFVITELNNKFLLLDPIQKTSFKEFYGEKAKVIAKYSYEGAFIEKFLYKFNHSNYEQF